MACCQDYLAGIKFECGVAFQVIANNTFYGVILYNKIDHMSFEMYLATMINNGLAHGLDDLWQFVGANVRVRLHKYIFIGAVAYKQFQHFVHIAALGGTGV